MTRRRVEESARTRSNSKKSCEILKIIWRQRLESLFGAGPFSAWTCCAVRADANSKHGSMPTNKRKFGIQSTFDGVGRKGGVWLTFDRPVYVTGQDARGNVNDSPMVNSCERSAAVCAYNLVVGNGRRNGWERKRKTSKCNLIRFG